ncbi:MAG TPA: PD-(D/E)XK nuclease family protein [Gaiellaceae bacterium]
MGLSLIAGPANAGKVALLLERYLAVLDRGPILIVPNRSDVERVERDLLARSGALLGGSIGTFDDVFERIVRGGSGERRVLADAQRSLLVRRIVGDAALNGLRRSARFAGFADSLATTFAELESGLLEPDALEGDLARLFAAYRSELTRLDRWDRDALRRHAVGRLQSDFEAWHGEPVFAYGFEDLTGAEWELLRALAGRTDVTVSLPYEQGRTAFESLRPTMDDLSALADGRIEILPARFHEFAAPALAHLERSLFADDIGEQPPPDGAVRFFEGAGTRATLELVGQEVLTLIRGGTAPEQIAIVCPALERWRAPLETGLGALGVPVAVASWLRLPQTPFGRALLGLLRFVWLGGGRRELYGFLRTPYSGVPRAKADFLEGRLRGRAINAHDRVEAETLALHGNPFPVVKELREAATPLDGLRATVARLLHHAYGTQHPPASEDARRDLRAYEAVTRLITELEGWVELGGTLTAEEIVGALERTTVRGADGRERGRVAVLDLLRARTRSFEVVFVLGLEEGTFPRRTQATPFLDDDARRALGSARLVKPDQVARDRYLFYTVCTRATRRLYLVREAASDEGVPREPSPFWDEVARLFSSEDVRHATTRRPLSALTWPLEAAPTERERLRALAALAAHDEPEATGLALANGWDRRLDRAMQAFRRPTQLRHPLVLEYLGERTSFNVTELERFSDCSSAWFVDRLLDPRTIDADVDPKLRGSVAHSALHKFFSGIPKELGVERLDETQLDRALPFLRRCLDQAVNGVRMELTELQRQELDQSLWRDLEAFVRAEASSKVSLVPQRFEVSFGRERSTFGGLDLGEGLSLSGKIDRIDLETFGARGIVQDYKSGRRAHSAQEIAQEQRLQIPLYMLVLRDLVGIEPLGGLYRPLAGERKARGLLRASAKEELPGYTRTDYLADEDFWARLESARDDARTLAQRIREGDVRHDPRGGSCPPWCDLWRVCRVARA